MMCKSPIIPQTVEKLKNSELGCLNINIGSCPSCDIKSI